MILWSGYRLSTTQVRFIVLLGRLRDGGTVICKCPSYSALLIQFSRTALCLRESRRRVFVDIFKESAVQPENMGNVRFVRHGIGNKHMHRNGFVNWVEAPSFIVRGIVPNAVRDVFSNSVCVTTIAALSIVQLTSGARACADIIWCIPVDHSARTAVSGCFCCAAILMTVRSTSIWMSIHELTIAFYAGVSFCCCDVSPVIGFLGKTLEYDLFSTHSVAKVLIVTKKTQCPPDH